MKTVVALLSALVLALPARAELSADALARTIAGREFTFGQRMPYSFGCRNSQAAATTIGT